MQHIAPLAAPRENIFAVLASSARKLSDAELGSMAAVSGIVALATVALGRTSWMLLAACYVVWCFAGWGILFRSTEQRSPSWQVFELVIVGSASAVFIALGVGLFFLALGPHWQL